MGAAAEIRIPPQKSTILFRNGRHGKYIFTGYLKGGSHSTVLKAVDLQDTEYVIKEVNGSRGRDKLINEIRWLRSLPPDVAPNFSKVIESRIDESRAYYMMPFYPRPSLREAMFRGELSGEEALGALERVLNFMLSKVYTRNRAEAKPEYTREVFFRRVTERLQELREAAPLFGPILSARELAFNGEVLPNCPRMIEEMQAIPGIMDRLTSPFLCLAHGNFHFDNILASNRGGLDSFMLIDPRGDAHKDPYHDLGKLLTSFYAGYDFVHYDCYTVSCEIAKGRPRIKMRRKAHPAMAEYYKIFKGFPAMLHSMGFFEGGRDPDWEMRNLFYQAFHILSFLPFHLKGDGAEKRAVVFYALATKLLNEALSIYKDQGGGYLSAVNSEADRKAWYIEE